MSSSTKNQISSSSFSSTDLIASNEDIVTEILLRLPAKELVKFKSVSKRWLYLISDPSFVLRHCRQNPQLVSGFILAYVFSSEPPPNIYISLDENENSTGGRTFNLTFDPFAPSAIRISQSCNGLLLCYSQLTGLLEIRHQYYIFNPTTSRFSVLPEPFGPKASCYFYTLAYDPTVSPFYRVVYVRFFHNKGCNIQIYSSETRTWRDARNPVSGSFSITIGHGVFWKGGVHWISIYDGNSFRFDIEQETLRAMPRLPLAAGDHWSYYNFRHFLGCQGRHLFLICFECPEYLVYEMEQDFSKWTLKHRLDINQIVTAFPADMTKAKEISSDSPMDLEKFISLVSVVEVKNEGPSLVVYIPGRYYIYNPATSRYSVLMNRLDLLKPLSVAFYQVVCVRSFHTVPDIIQIYSSETHSWRDTRVLDFGSFSSEFRHGVFWNGGVHWINTDDGNSFRFDIEHETPQEKPRPPLPAERWDSKNFRHFMEYVKAICTSSILRIA